MHLFKIRSKSSQPQSNRSQDSSSGSISSSRPPLLTQTNLALPESPTLSLRNDLDIPPSKYSIGRKISNHEPEEHRSEVHSTRNLAPPPRTPSRTLKMTYANHSDMYTQNDLNTFSFGAAPSSSSPLNPIDPLSRPRDDPDPDDLLIPDITPRPSVVGAQHPRSHQSQQSLGVEFDQSPYRSFRVKSNKGAGKKPYGTDSDTASTHTFGNSSTSVSTHSRPSGTSSRATSRTSGRSNTTPQTSDNGLTSDEEPDGRHPLPAELSSPDLHYEYRHTDQNSSMYPSEEEFDVYNDDYDHDPDTGIEIESVAHTGSDRGTFDYHNTSQESGGFDYAERRGSQALPIIPITSPSDRSSPDISYLENRVRENSLATLRRPSRSLDELYSFNFATASSSSTYPTERPLPPAPMSVPESEGDWRDLRKKSIQRDKDLPPISPYTTSTNVGATSAQNQNTSELDGFDSSWMHQYGVNGVVGFDLSEMQDIVEENGTGRRSSNYPFRKESAISAFRRQSNVSNNNVDIMYRHATGKWASQKYRDQQRMWTFMKEHDRLPDEDLHIRQNQVERERSSISSFFASRPNNSVTPEPGVISSGIPFFDGNRDKEKAAGKEKAPKEIWRGMPLDSEEFWNNQATGRFRVHRKNTPCPEVGKPPQQRLNITFIRTPYVVNPITRDVLDGPAVTIHRHSKAGAFSISRHFRAKGVPNPSDTTVSLRNTASSSRGQPSLKDSSDGARKRSDMILLATRKVQKAYTSTNTTRKLQSHGLLDDSGCANSRDVEKMKKEHEREMRAKAKEKAQDKVKDKDTKEREAPKEKRKGVSAIKKITSRGESKSKDIPDSSGGSSAGSVANALSSDSSTFVHTSTATTTPDSSEATSSHGSIEQSIFSFETTSSDRATLRAASLRSRHQRRYLGDFGDDSSDEGPRYPTRTPHRETYAVLSPEVLESAHHQEHPTHGLFGWGKSKSGNQIGHRPNPYEASYNPPWAVTAPRITSETRKGIVDDLNTSFQDVGLLPAIGEIKNSHNGQIKRKREREQQQAMHVNRRPDQTQTEIFGGVPSDALCMLLPLWPGETDPASARKHPSALPPLSIESRQYVLVYYNTQPEVSPREEGKTKSGDKKRSRHSPTSTHDSASKRAERGVLLNNFYIGARVISHCELQGTGIRIPDVGLAVSGPLEDAYNNMPTAVPHGEYILGMCNSRDAGIDFLQEGFEKLGLSRSMPNPNPIVADDDDDCQSLDTITVLTPLGRAVMEMAWLGGLALTSFNPNG